MAKLYVLLIYSADDAFVLGSEGYESRERAERAIRWQKVGQGERDRHEICTRTGPDTFSNGHETFKATRGAYNERFWAEFKAQWEEPQIAPEGGS